MKEVKMVVWHHWLDEHEFEQAPDIGDGRESLACCSPWGRKELDTTEQLYWTELMIILFLTFRSFYCAYLYNPASKTLPKNHISLARRTKTTNQKQTHTKQTKTKNQNKGKQNQSPGRDQFKASPSQPPHKGSTWSTAHALARLALTTAQWVGLLAAL